MRKQRMLELIQYKNGLNKLELCMLLAQEMDLAVSESQEILDHLLNIMTLGLMEDRKILISDFGVFQITHRDSFEGYNPHTQERIQVPARAIPSFKAGKRLKIKLNPS